MTDTQIINAIHNSDLRPIWDGLTREAKEQVLRELDGDLWNVSEVIYQAAEQALEAA